ncbi:hypothetical protein [Hoeflea sp.]|uniref:hypothetical protein n=1 Tax=Hoeflea sp. TaxID=1940281 RepID=UPI0019C3469A|nr:hypothetical protein [Hoeflea sp.]MBC7284666.1 hypothetical protein [Hoeflea sp.]
MTTDIVPFPTPVPSPVPKPGNHQSRRKRIMRQRGQPLSSEQTAAADEMSNMMVGTPRPWTAEDRAANVAMVVRIAIRSARRRGVRLESLLSIPRRRLLDLCVQGDPTCLVVRDWLMGNRKYLPDGFEESFSASTAKNREDA